MALSDTPIIQLKNVSKNYANISALRGVNLSVRQGEVTCILGDNGAGKSTLISIIAGLHPHSDGEYLVDDQPRRFSSPREALNLGISAVYQTLALVPLLPVWRNFFLGSEIVKGGGLFQRLDAVEMRARAQVELERMGIHLEDLEQPVGTLSGGQRQVVAIARAVHFGARVLILDEPTAALGVAQSGLVLRYIKQAARNQGIGVIFITHNPHHAYLVGDHFMVLARGEVELDSPRSELSLDNLMFHMSGGRGLSALEHEIQGEQGTSSPDGFAIQPA
jgi:simple sugar transport system ATP-binding protein